MKKSRNIRGLLLASYCIPFAFLAVSGDAFHGTMFFYAVMVAGILLLCRAAFKTNNVPVIYLGNALSFASSCLAAKLSGLEAMGAYFKPFTAYSLIVALSAFSVIAHTMAVLANWAKNKKRR